MTFLLAFGVWLAVAFSCARASFGFRMLLYLFGLPAFTILAMSLPSLALGAGLMLLWVVGLPAMMSVRDSRSRLGRRLSSTGHLPLSESDPAVPDHAHPARLWSLRHGLGAAGTGATGGGMGGFSGGGGSFGGGGASGSW